MKTFPPLIRGFFAVVAIVTTFALVGCLEPSPEVTEIGDAQELVDNLTYVKAKNGICFAVGTTSRISTNGTVAYSNQLTTVPCDQAGFAEEAK